MDEFPLASSIHPQRRKKNGPGFGPVTLAFTSAGIIGAAAHGDPNLNPIMDHCQEVVWDAVKPAVDTVFHQTQTLLEKALEHFQNSGN